MSGEMKIRYCRKCGAQLKEGYKFCIKCGAPVDTAEASSEGGLKFGSGSGAGDRIRPAAETGKSGSVKFNTGFAGGGAGPAYGSGAPGDDIKRDDPYSGMHFHTDSREPERSFSYMDSKTGSLYGETEERKQVRKYFRGAQNALKVFIMICGIFAGLIIGGLTSQIVGLILVIAAIAAVIFWILSVKFKGEPEALAAIEFEKQRMTKRGLERIRRETGKEELIEPVIVYGFGSSPDISLKYSIKQSSIGIIRLIQYIKKGPSDWDPEELYRFGSDDILRSMLLMVTVYVFSEEQLHLYIGNVDVSTGSIYSETMTDIFYQDISAVTLQQKMIKRYNPSRRKYQRFVREYIRLLGGGFQYNSSFQSDMNNRKTDSEFTGMKNLIREKKKEIVGSAE